MLGCKARREGDEMYCHACGLRWDISDPERPLCDSPYRQHAKAIERRSEKIYGKEANE